MQGVGAYAGPQRLTPGRHRAAAARGRVRLFHHDSSGWQPHTAPVCFIWDGSAVLIFAQPESVKARNLRQNPRVTLALDDFGRNNAPVVVEGLATLVSEPGVSITMAPYVEKYSRVIRGDGRELGADGGGLFAGHPHRANPHPARSIGAAICANAAPGAIPARSRK